MRDMCCVVQSMYIAQPTPRWCDAMVDRVSRRSLSAPSQMFTHTLFKAKLRSYKSRNIHEFFFIWNDTQTHTWRTRNWRSCWLQGLMNLLKNAKIEEDFSFVYTCCFLCGYLNIFHCCASNEYVKQFRSAHRNFIETLWRFNFLVFISELLLTLFASSKIFNDID